jgi:xanthine/CO dehydrogenase XdhC/CoxF family maturation factor
MSSSIPQEVEPGSERLPWVQRGEGEGGDVAIVIMTITAAQAIMSIGEPGQRRGRRSSRVK